MEDIYLGLILLFFILAFAVKNITTYFSTGKSIRGQSTKVTLSVLLSTIIYLLIGIRLILGSHPLFFEFAMTQLPGLKVAGLVLVTLGFIMGLLSLITMKSSWRVGIKYDQKTTLITNGVYRFSRNPYFFSYDILILGYILIFPSMVLLLLYIPLVIVFHRMILEEEKYLLSVHKEDYAAYKQKTNRYFTFK